MGILSGVETADANRPTLTGTPHGYASLICVCAQVFGQLLFKLLSKWAIHAIQASPFPIQIAL
jgi:hypothetical protein